MLLIPADLSMGEVMSAGTRGEYQMISKASTRSRLIWPLGRLR